MRLILEKAEIVSILGKHFEANFDPGDVIIRTDPFEIELRGLPLGDAPPKQVEEETNVVPLPTRLPYKDRVEEDTTPPKQRADPGASNETPPPGDDGLGGGSTAEVHPAAVLAQSKALEAELDRENPQLKRRSGNYSHTDPEGFKDEIG